MHGSRRPWVAIAAAIVAAALATTASGCGEAAADAATTVSAPAPAAAGTVPVVAPVRAGGRVERSAGTPAAVAKALAGNKVIVVAFLLSDAADDRAVAGAVRTVRDDEAYRSGVRYFVYHVDRGTGFGDLADQLGVEGTPAVAVIGRDRNLVNLWTGLVDAPMLRQSIADASSSAALNPVP